MSEKEKRVCEVFGESSCSSGESEQDAHRRTEITQGAVLPEGGTKLGVGGGRTVVHLAETG